MTIITKPLSEKKCDKTQEPLVDGPKVGIVDVSGRVPLGGHLEMGPSAVEMRVSSATTACLFLTALLVMSCGIISGVCLYQQFGKAHQVQRFLCSIPFGKEKDGRPVASGLRADDYSYFEKMTKGLMGEKGGYLNEEVEIDESYEKITVPDFSGGRRSKFIHDFKSNKSCIIDLDGQRCFVMPLNRTVILPPKNLIDVIEKMKDGYYNVDTEILRETMRVVTPEIENRSSLGPYIQRECYGYPIYKLEKYFSGVFKRSASKHEVNFVEFAGTATHELHIINYDQLAEHEAQQPIAMA